MDFNKRRNNKGLWTIILSAFVLLSICACTPNMVDRAKNMVWSKLGKSLDVLLNEHPLVDKESVKWYFDDTTDPKTVILQFSCHDMTKEFTRKLAEEFYASGDEELIADSVNQMSSKITNYKITFVVGSKIIKVVDCEWPEKPMGKNLSFDTFISNLERPDKDYVGFVVVK